MKIAQRAAWLFVAGLAVCAAVRTISREEWNQQFNSDIAQEFQTEAQLQEYTASLFQPSSSAHAVGGSRERRQRKKQHFVLALEDSNLLETHAHLREALEASGGSYTLGPKGKYAFVNADAETVKQLQSELAPSLRGLVHMRGAMKVARNVNELQCSEASSEAKALAELQVLLGDVDQASYEQSVSWLQQTCSAHGWQLELPRRFRGKGTPVVGVRMSCSSVMEGALQLAELESVLWIEPKPQHKLTNYYAQGISQSGKVGDTPLYKAGLSGDGEIVGLSDSGIDMDHCYFQDTACDPFDSLDTTCRKVVYYETYGPSDLPDLDDIGHGTHVAGSIAGACTDCSGNKKKFRGMAFNARLAFIDLSDTTGSSLSTPFDLYGEVFSVLYDQGARVQSHSWGSDPSGVYTTAAYHADSFMHDNEEALILFAAGNEGETGSESILSPAISRNVLSVGASLNAHEAFEDLVGDVNSRYNEDNLAKFSSIGPTSDGRLKPEVCAPGHIIFSADAQNGDASVCSRVEMSGTSMATPVTAGNAALAREYFLAGYYPTGERNAADGFTPSGALLKAVLVHSTRAMKGRFQPDDSVSDIPYPGWEQGFGRVMIGDVLPTPKNNYFTLIAKGDISATDNEFTANGQEHHISVQAIGNSKYQRALVATLVWVDPPTFGSGALVNNLDLFITNEDTGTVYRPLWSDTMDNKDTLNPVEKVVISEPTLFGNYTVTVRAESLGVPNQKYALVITGTFEGHNYDVPKDDEPSAFEKLLEDLGMTKQEFTIGVVLIGAVAVFSCCCGERRRRKRGDRHREAYHPNEVL